MTNFRYVFFQIIFFPSSISDIPFCSLFTKDWKLQTKDDFMMSTTNTLQTFFSLCACPVRPRTHKSRHMGVIAFAYLPRNRTRGISNEICYHFSPIVGTKLKRPHNKGELFRPPPFPCKLTKRNRGWETAVWKNENNCERKQNIDRFRGHLSIL